MNQVIEITEHRARVRHVCDYCSGFIYPNQPYVSEFMVWEGDAYRWKMHHDCRDLAQWYWTEFMSGSDEGIPSMSEWLLEDFEGHPKELAKYNEIQQRAKDSRSGTDSLTLALLGELKNYCYALQITPIEGLGRLQDAMGRSELISFVSAADPAQGRRDD